MKVIYILGSGHCGSTLLDLILGSAKNTFSFGELAFYNAYIEQRQVNTKSRKRLCTCRKELKDCAFWSEIIASDDFVIKKNYSFVESIERGLKIVLSPNTSHVKPIDHSFELMKSAHDYLEKTGQKIDVFIDSSKDPRRLHDLLKDERLEVYPICLFREGRAVAYSYLKRNQKKNFYRKSLFNIVLFRWLGVYWLSRKLCRSNRNGMIIRYEDLCSDTSAILSRISSATGIDLDLNNYVQAVNATSYHNLDGSKVKLRKFTELSENKDYIQKMSRFYKCLVMIILFPVYKLWKIY